MASCVAGATSASPDRTAPASGTVISSTWPECSTATFVDHVTGRHGTKDTLQELYSAKHRATAPHTEWKQRIENGQISVNGVVVRDPDFNIRCRAVLEYRRAPWTEPEAPNWLTIAYIDDHLVAVDKPAGLQVLPNGRFHHRCVLTILHEHFGAPLPTPVHRIGRGTSGLLLCARSTVARQRLTAMFASKTQQQHVRSTAGSTTAPVACQQQPDHALRKLYLALVTGNVTRNSGSVDVPIGRRHHEGLASGLHVADMEHGKPAKSLWSVVCRLTQQDATVLAVEIFSGRPHQIRIHCAFIGHPLVGDPLYAAGGGLRAAAAGDAVNAGKTAAMPGDVGYSLHSWQLKLRHPVTGELMHLIGGPPSPFKEALEGANDWSWV